MKGIEERAEELKELFGIGNTELEDRAYQCAYDLSNDWLRDTPTWKDVEQAYIKGATEQKEIDNTEREEIIRNFEGAKLLINNLQAEKDTICEHIIDKACKWLRMNIHKDLSIGTYDDTVETIIEDFKNVLMK